MSSIDERVVRMQFDNKKFEAGVRESNKSLEELKKSLDMSGPKKGLAGFQSAANAFSLKGISDGVATLQDRISAFGAVGFTIIQNLTNAAIDFGKRMIGLVWDPLIEGGKRRALNIEQAKFQFRGLGVDVEQAMSDALFAVQGTAFGLDEAAKAASQLSASQVALGDDMRTSLRAISGVAAMTNSSYEDTARIFTTVAGNGRLMGDQLNQISSRGLNAAATLATAMGVTEAEVRDMVSKGEISFDIFSKAMDDAFGENATKANETFTGSLANMRAALARIGAAVATTSFENQRDVFNALTPVIDNVKTALEPLIKLINEYTTAASVSAVNFLGNLDIGPFATAVRIVSEGIKNVREVVSGLLGVIGGAFNEFFPMDTGQIIIDIAFAFYRFSEAIKMGAQDSGNFQTAVRGIFAALSIFWEILKGIGGLIARVFTALAPTGSLLLQLAAALGMGTMTAQEFLVEGGAIAKFFEVLGNVITAPIQYLETFVGWLTQVVHRIRDLKIFESFGDPSKFGDDLTPLQKIGNTILMVWEKIVFAFQKVREFLAPAFDAIGEFFSGVGNALVEAFNDKDIDTVLAVINTTLLGGIIALITSFFKSGLKLDVGGGFFGSINVIFGRLTGALANMQATLKADVLIKIAAAIGILTISVIALSLVDPEKLGAALGAMTIMFTQLFTALAVFEKTTSGIDGLKMAGISAGLILLAIAMSIMAGAVSKLAKNDWNELARGLTGITVILGVLAGFMKLIAKNTAGMVAAGIGITAIAIALNIMAGAVSKFGEMDWDVLLKGVGSIAALLAVVAGFAKISANPLKMVATAASIMILSVALIVLSKAVESFGSMDWEVIGRGLLAMAGALAIIVLAIAFLPVSMILTATSLVILGGALLIIAEAMQSFGSLSWEQVGSGLTLLAGTLAILAGAMALMGIPIVLLGAVGIIAAAGALAILAPAMVLLGSISWDSIGRGLAVLAGTLAILALGGVLLIPAIPAFLALGAAILLFGAGTLAAGIGIGLFAAGLAALAAGGGAAAAVFILVLQGVIGLIPQLMGAIGDGVVAFAEAISRGGTEMTAAFTTVLQSIITSINDTAPMIVDTLVMLVTMLVDTLETKVPEFVESGLNMIVGILQGIANNIGRIVSVGINIVTELLNGISKSLPRLIQAAFNLVITFIESLADAIRRNSERMRQAGRDLATAIIDGMTGGLASQAGKVMEEARRVANGVITSAKNALGIRSPSREAAKLGRYFDEGLAKGIGQYSTVVNSASKSVANESLMTLKKSLSGVNKMVQMDFNNSPTIRPVVDLSNVEQSMGQIDGMFGARAISFDKAYLSASAASVGYQSNRDAIREQQEEASVNKVEYVQNNYSPKSLSSAEIYRNTRNQLSVAKEASRN